ncbi:MAG: hypothetical protein ABIT01_04590 [Thermoanaerobaculia bacterium]
MKTATLDELQKNSALLKEVGPILVTKEGHPIGFFRPLLAPDESLSIQARRELFKKASDKVRRLLNEKGITEEQVDTDIAALFEDDRR